MVQNESHMGKIFKNQMDTKFTSRSLVIVLRNTWKQYRSFVMLQPYEVYRFAISDRFKYGPKLKDEGTSRF